MRNNAFLRVSVLVAVIAGALAGVPRSGGCAPEPYKEWSGSDSMFGGFGYDSRKSRIEEGWFSGRVGHHEKEMAAFKAGQELSGPVKNDFHWVLQVLLKKPSRIDSITVFPGTRGQNHQTGQLFCKGQGWSTAKGTENECGAVLDPLLVFFKGSQLNAGYDQTLGEYPADKLLTFDLFGPARTDAFEGGGIRVELSDGSHLISGFGDELTSPRVKHCTIATVPPPWNAGQWGGKAYVPVPDKLQWKATLQLGRPLQIRSMSIEPYTIKVSYKGVELDAKDMRSLGELPVGGHTFDIFSAGPIKESQGGDFVVEFVDGEKYRVAFEKSVPGLRLHIDLCCDRSPCVEQGTAKVPEKFSISFCRHYKPVSDKRDYLYVVGVLTGEFDIKKRQLVLTRSESYGKLRIRGAAKKFTIPLSEDGSAKGEILYTHKDEFFGESISGTISLDLQVREDGRLVIRDAAVSDSFDRRFFFPRKGTAVKTHGELFSLQGGHGDGLSSVTYDNTGFFFDGIDDGKVIISAAPYESEYGGGGCSEEDDTPVAVLDLNEAGLATYVHQGHSFEFKLIAEPHTREKFFVQWKCLDTEGLRVELVDPDK